MVLHRRSKLLICPAQERGIPSYGAWYHLQDIPSFPVCSKCYVEHIESTSLARHFREASSDPSGSISCAFYTPRARTIWADCISKEDIAPLTDYATERDAILPCAGATTLPLEAEREIFIPQEGQGLDAFVVCRACYEDFIATTGIGDRFVRLDTESLVGDDFMCFAATAFARAVLVTRPNDDWETFVETVQTRMDARPCPGASPVEDGTMYWTTEEVPALAVCDACYQDSIMFSPFFDDFTVAPPQGRWTCDLARIDLLIAIDIAAKKRSLQSFVTAANVAFSNEKCSAEGRTNGEWYVLTTSDNAHPFDVCPTCFECYIGAAGGGALFKKRSYVRDETRLCSFRPTAPLTVPLITYIQQALDTGDWTPFKVFAAKAARIPACPRNKMVSGAQYRWYGSRGWAACEVCYLTVLKGSPLDGKIPLVGVALEPGASRWCELYSARMRALCAQGDLSALEDAATERLAVHTAVSQRLEFLQAELNILRQMQHTKRMVAIKMQGTEGMALALGSGTHWRNNATGHMYATSSGASVDAMYRSADDMSSEIMNKTMQAVEMEQQWARVE